MLIFILQSVWLYISELAGKDLEIDIILKFLVLVSPRLVVLVLPLTILLVSIMVFGNFAENYEFAAMKSTGISLQRAMRSLSVFILLLAVTTFFFSNNVIPSAEFKFNSLRRNIAKVKPAMAIAEGQFNKIGNINIQVKKKSGDRGQFLEDVTIHQKTSNRPGNFTVIKARTGELTSTEDSDVLQLILHDGNYHNDLQPKEFRQRRKAPHIKSHFEKYTLNVDLAHLNNVDFDEETAPTRANMLTIKDLDYTIDSLVTKKEEEYVSLSKSMYNRSTATTLGGNITIIEEEKKYNGDDILDLFRPNQKLMVVDLAINNVKSTNQIIQAKKKQYFEYNKNLNKHIIYFYDKFALAFACVILFFIGAPLGALIRKGGLGLPIIVAILLFLTYHFIGIFAKNSAEDGSLNPAIAPWFSTLVMFPLSVYLTNRATKDRTLLDLDAMLVPIKKFVGIKPYDYSIDETSILDNSSEDYQHLQGYSDQKLIDLIKNYRQYDKDVSYRNTSIQIMKSRGTTKEQLRLSGNLINENYEDALRYKNSFDENSRMAFLLYTGALIGDIVGAVLRNNGFPSLGQGLFIFGMVITFLYFITFSKTVVNLSKFYKVLGKNTLANFAVLIVIGFPLYFVYKIFFTKKMRNDMKEIR
jgi:lipopolysaccharide export system permease protein